MNFASFPFIAFAGLVILVYYIVPGWLQWLILLAASFLFYFWADPRYLLFLLLTIGTVYGSARMIGRNLEKLKGQLSDGNQQLPAQERKKLQAMVKRKNRRVVLLCMAVNFLVLLLCKISLTMPVRSILLQGKLSFLTVGLPLGISFYMFQSAGYLIDVYRDKVKAEHNPARFALFVSYFPQLVQGPISRYHELSQQLAKPHPFDFRSLSFGFQRVLWGYFKKLVIADRIGVAVRTLRGEEYLGVGFAVLTVFYAVQLYCDFTGGIDIAIGLSETLGIRLPENFIRPFFSKNIAEYWRRWHITLGEWMKDYIFYPLSVSRPMMKFGRLTRKKLGGFGKRMPLYVTSFATWCVTGIWHGVTPNFILWGITNWLIIVLSEEMTPLYRKFHDRFHLNEKRWYSGFEIVRMFLLMNLIRAWDLFPNIVDYLHRMGSLIMDPHWKMLTDGTLQSLGLSGLDYGILLYGIVLVFVVSMAEEKRGDVREILAGKPFIVRYLIFAGLFLAVLLMGSYGIGYDSVQFIYNQF